MNDTNRILNRMLLLIVGAALAAAGAAAILAAARPAWAADALAVAERWVRTAISDVPEWTVGVPGIGEVRAAMPLALLAGTALIILLVVFLATRGGGGTSTVLRIEGEQGATAVDRSVADAALAAGIRERPDVLSARTSVYRVRRAPAIRLTVTARQGAQLPRVIRAVESAVATWDVLAGQEIPVVLHLHGRSRWDRWRSATRVR